MKVKTANLIDQALDWAVAKAKDLKWFLTTPDKYLCVWKICSLTGEPEGSCSYDPSTNWAQGGPIVDGMMASGLQLKATDRAEPHYKCAASLSQPYGFYFGPTPLISAMRCFVASKLGDEVDVPEELV
jgi:hypothetical protein